MYVPPECVQNPVPLRLYEGRMSWTGDGWTADGIAQIAFRWRPKPRFECQFMSTGAQVQTRASARFDLMDLDGIPAPPTCDGVWELQARRDGFTYYSQFDPRPLSFGVPTSLHSLELLVVNSDELTIGGRNIDVDDEWVREYELDTSEWVVRLRALHDPGVRVRDLTAETGYAFTHTLHIARSDGGPFDFADTDRLREAFS